MAQESAAAGQGFGIGATLSTSLAVLGRNLVTFVAIAVLIGIPYILVIMIGAGAAGVTQGADGAESMSVAMGATMAIGGLVALLTYVVAQAAINYGAFQDLRGQKPVLGDCLRHGFAAMPRVIGAGIMAILVVFGGMIVATFLAFIPVVGILVMIAAMVGAFILFIMWWVIIPVLVVEKTGIIECFGRSRALTAGNRWRILGLLIVVGLLQGMVNGVVQFVGRGGGSLMLVSLVLTVAVMLVFIAFNSVLTAVGYYYLRSAKEGIVIDDIVRVFD
jgi:hypothetical protein